MDMVRGYYIHGYSENVWPELFELGMDMAGLTLL